MHPKPLNRIHGPKGILWVDGAPIAVFIEYIPASSQTFGEYVDLGYCADRSSWNQQLSVRPEGTVSLKVRSGRIREVPRITLESTVSFKMRINWGKGQTREVEIKPGTQTI